MGANQHMLKADQKPTTFRACKSVDGVQAIITLIFSDIGTARIDGVYGRAAHRGT